MWRTRHYITSLAHGPALADAATVMDAAVGDRLLPAENDLRAILRRDHRGAAEHGWRVKMRDRFGYCSPDQWYEAVVDRLVTRRCRWIDVGGGRSLFPQNETLARELAARCDVLVGVDPSENILANPFVHQRVRSGIEEYRPEEPFDVATLRMVVEHIREPARVVASLRALVRPGGHAVIYTPSRWAPTSLAAALIPDRFHGLLTRLSDSREGEDVFPTVYRMNTRGRLKTLFELGGFEEAAFAYLDNCRMFQRLRLTCFAELCAWRALRAVGLRYPESDLLGVYRRN